MILLQLSVPFSATSIMPSHSAGSSSQKNGAVVEVGSLAALLMSTSNRPKAVRASSRSRSTSDMEVTSVRTKIASPPASAISCAAAGTVSSAPSLMSAMTIFAPSRANARAVARPIPLAPPVMTTTWPASPRSTSSSVCLSVDRTFWCCRVVPVAGSAVLVGEPFPPDRATDVAAEGREVGRTLLQEGVLALFRFAAVLEELRVDVVDETHCVDPAVMAVDLAEQPLEQGEARRRALDQLLAPLVDLVVELGVRDGDVGQTQFHGLSTRVAVAQHPHLFGLLQTDGVRGRLHEVPGVGG